jgi:hypothetical protein
MRTTPERDPEQKAQRVNVAEAALAEHANRLLAVRHRENGHSLKESELAQLAYENSHRLVWMKRRLWQSEEQQIRK